LPVRNLALSPLLMGRAWVGRNKTILFLQSLILFRAKRIRKKEIFISPHPSPLQQERALELNALI